MKWKKCLIFFCILCLLGFMFGCNSDSGGGGSSSNDSNSGSSSCPATVGNLQVIGNADGSCTIQGGDLKEKATLTNNKVWKLDGDLIVGELQKKDPGAPCDQDWQTAELSIEPGTKIVGIDKSFLSVQRGSKLHAVGNSTHPILMTSEDESGAGQWGGLIINGYAPMNRGTCAQGEGNVGLYGGNVKTDDSGELKYVVVAHAGDKQSAQVELNGTALQGVGSGTEINHIQVHENSDDGVEFFGGTAQVKHVFLTDNHDDSLDWTDGWQGKAQYVSIHKKESTGDNGIEADNLEGSPDAQPRSDPKISNLTMKGYDGNDLGLKLRRGTYGKFYNLIAVDFGQAQLGIDSSETNPSFANSVLYSQTSSKIFDQGNDGIDESNWFKKVDNNLQEDPNLNSQMVPQLEKLNNNASLSTGSLGSFFDDVDYAGAFDPDASEKWSEGWTIPHGGDSTQVWDDSLIEK